MSVYGRLYVNAFFCSDIPEDLKGIFDVVIADPPFLNDDCLTKTAITIKLLAKDKLILCTGT